MANNYTNTKLDSGTLITKCIGSKNKRLVWELLCNCGNIYEANSNRIQQGLADICTKCKTDRQRTVDLVGTTFGNNCKVLEEIEQIRYPSKIVRCYLVECHCGNLWNIIQDHTYTVKECQSCAHKSSALGISRDKHWNYRGVSTIDKKRQNAELKRARKQVLKRDKYRCYLTKSKVNLEVHHLDSWDWCINRRFDINNMITLSKPIHDLFHENYGRGNNTKRQFNEFVTNFSIK